MTKCSAEVPYICGEPKESERIGKIEKMKHKIQRIAQAASDANVEGNIVAETRRPLETQINEYEQNKKEETRKSKIGEHSRYFDHRIQWDKLVIIQKEGKRISRKLKQSVLIRTTEQVISQT
jgi:hypothetical protein